MYNAMRQLVSAAAVALGLGMAAATGPASAVTMYPDGANGPSPGTLGTVNPGGVNPWRGDWNHGEGYFSGQGGELAYDRTTDGGVTVSTPNPWRGAWNVGAGQGNGFWGPVDAAGAAAGAIVGAARGAPLRRLQQLSTPAAHI